MSERSWHNKIYGDGIMIDSKHLIWNSLNEDEDERKKNFLREGRKKLYLMYNVCICALKASEIYGGRQMTCKNIKSIESDTKISS